MKRLKIYYSPTSTDGGVATADAQTDNKKLVTTDTVFVSPDGGTTDEAFPAPAIEYDFCVDVTNTGTLSSGPFFVRFTLDNGTGGSGNQVFDFKQEAGLDASQSVSAVVHFGQFTNDDVNYTLSACIFAPSAPEVPINCAGTFGFNPHMNNNTPVSSSGNSNNGNSTNPDNGSNTNSNDTATGTSNNSSSTDTGASNNSSSTATDASNNSSSTDTGASNGTAPNSGGTTPTDEEGFKLLDSGSWNGSSSLNYQGGQVMHFKVKNVNVLGATIKIKSNLSGEKFSMVLPHQTVDLRFDCFGAEPMGWTFNISSDSDAFIVAWSLYSSWVTGDLPNK